MSIVQQEITEREISELHVEGAPDSLIGVPAKQVKQLFDKLPKLIAQRHNGIVDGLLSKSGASELGSTAGNAKSTVQADLDRLEQVKAAASKVNEDSIALKNELSATINAGDAAALAQAKSYTDDAVFLSGSGDMTKSVYDTDGDGVVDSAENGIFPFTHTALGNVHTLNGVMPACAVSAVSFKATARFKSGDSLKVNGEDYRVINQMGEAPANGFAKNAIVLAGLDSEDKALTLSTDYSGANKGAVRYGVRVKKSESDPYNRVEYIYDSVGMTPCKMNYQTGEFEYGSWRGFLEALCKPCIVGYDLSIIGELDRFDHTKFKDGAPSGIESFETQGNAMSVFEKWYQSIREEGDYEYFVISNIKWDASYTDLHCYNENGVSEYMMLPMYPASFDGTRLRSISGKSLDGGKTREQEITAAKANGNGWGTLSYAKWLHRNIILKLIGKSTNSQAVFGNGNMLNNVSLQTGSLNDKGMFYGFSDNKRQVKVLWCEGIWGDKLQAMSGLVTDSAKNRLIKLIPPYSTTGAGYTSAGIAASLSGTIKSNKVSNILGVLPEVGGGTASTYESDYAFITATGYAMVGGNNTHGEKCGASLVYLGYKAISTDPLLVGSLSA